MKSTALFCVFLCFTMSYSLQLRGTNSLTMTSKIYTQLAEITSHQTGDMILSLADVYLSVQGPIDDLIKEIGNLLTDLNTKIQAENDGFAAATQQHNNRIAQLEAEIRSANEDIDKSIVKLNTVLYPRRTQLEGEIATLKTNIANNLQTQETETAQRQKDHDDYAQKQKEVAEALAAIDEALKLVQSLKNPQASLLQVRLASASLKKIQNTLVGKRNNYTPLISALLALSQNFSDQAAVDKVLDLLNRIRQNVVEEDQAEDAAEDAAQKQFNTRMASLKSELDNLRSTLAQRESDLVTCLAEIKAEEEFLEKRKNDKAGFDKETANENEAYKTLTLAHNDLIAQLQSEVDTVNKAIEILKNAGDNVRDYLKNRVNEQPEQAAASA